METANIATRIQNRGPRKIRPARVAGFFGVELPAKLFLSGLFLSTFFTGFFVSDIFFFSRFLGELGVHVLSKHSNKWKVAIFFIKVETISDDEICWNFKANIFNVDLYFCRLWLAQDRKNFNASDTS